jgi:hypothetical protein
MSRFYAFGIVGAVMVGVSIGLVAGIAHGIGLVGSCSSNGYIDGRPVPTCAAGDVVKIVGIFPAILLGLVGLVVSGRRAPRHKRTGTLGVTAWSVGYLVVGTALILTSSNPASKAEGLDRYGWAIPGYIFIPLGIAGLLFMLFRRRKSAVAQRLLATGVHATGRIAAVRDTGVTINNNPRIALEVEVPGAGRLMKTATVSRLAIPREGDEVQVWYDRDDPNTFAIGLPTGPTPAAATPAAPTDLTATLERLAKLRADGVLSDVEFETAKTRALAGA